MSQKVLGRVSEIIPSKLYLSDITAALDISVIKYFSITHIVNATNGAAPNTFPDILYHNVDIEDTEEADISSHLTESHAFISSALAGGGCVLVHCMAGVSRSSSITIHHIMMAGYSLRDAVKMLKTARPVVQPNTAFAKALVVAEKRERGENTMSWEEICGRGGRRLGGRGEEDIKNMMDGFGREEGRCLVL